MAMAVIAGTTSCDDFLDREPMSSISPETYYSTAAQLEANMNDEYPMSFRHSASGLMHLR